METIRYTDYLEGITNNTIDIDDVVFNVKLVSEDYIPSETHKPADVNKYIIAAIGALQFDDIKKLTMQEIIDRTKALLKEGISSFPSEVNEQIDASVSDADKREKLKELIRMPDADNFQYWNNLKENGISYFVFESVPDGVLCFCEEIQL